MFVCSAIALLFAPSIDRIPRAAMTRAARLRELRMLATAPSR
jgi:hypothetical protein